MERYSVPKGASTGKPRNKHKEKRLRLQYEKHLIASILTATVLTLTTCTQGEATSSANGDDKPTISEEAARRGMIRRNRNGNHNKFSTDRNN
ncbi:hypothetical protein [Corynebacterium mastitidis]